MATIDVSAENVFVPYHLGVGETEIVLDSYGSLERGNEYFDNRLRSRPWKRSTNDEKRAALREATEQIDCLNYWGIKSNDEQSHEFPRNGNTEVPGEIERATYEIALKLLDGFIPEMDVRNIPATSQGYSSARTSYDRSFVLEHIVAGIPSSKAWALLKPYLADPRSFELVRGS